MHRELYQLYVSRDIVVALQGTQLGVIGNLSAAVGR